MAIAIRMIGEKWRIQIRDEEWEVSNRKELDEILKKIFDWKSKKGRIKDGL